MGATCAIAAGGSRRDLCTSANTATMHGDGNDPAHSRGYDHLTRQIARLGAPLAESVCGSCSGDAGQLCPPSAAAGNEERGDTFLRNGARLCSSCFRQRDFDATWDRAQLGQLDLVVRTDGKRQNQHCGEFAESLWRRGSLDPVRSGSGWPDHHDLRSAPSQKRDHADWGDPRWVLCHRPAVIAGGELNMKMLDLQFNPVTKFYTGPLQMKANNGVLIVDDFGRQRARPEALLNRWVVPLDRRIDFLTLAGGRKIEIPFELLVVFATNLHPTDLADAAFLRRIPAKVKVGSASPQQFHEIFLRVCREYDLACEPELIDEIIRIIEERMKQPLRACYPRDLVNQVCWAARYEGKTPCLDRETLKRAIEIYFLPPK